MGQQSKVLVLNSLRSNDAVNFIEAINNRRSEVKCDLCTYDDLIIYFDEKDNISVKKISDDKSLSDYDLIYFKTYFKKAEFAVAVAGWAKSKGIKFIDQEVGDSHAYTKLSQYAKLAAAGLPIPKSIVVTHVNLASQYQRFVDELGLPFILKDAAAEKGRSNFLIKNQSEFNEAVKQAVKDEAYYVAQEYIRNEGDYRFIVLGEKLKFVLGRRQVDDTTHLSNTSVGGQASLVNLDEVSEDPRNIAIKAASVMNRQVAGVDLMQSSESGQWYILEVNNSPQLASGAFVNEKVAAMTDYLAELLETGK